MTVSFSGMPQPRGWGIFHAPLFRLCGLLLLVCLLYMPGLRGPFLFDDPPNLLFPLQAWLDGLSSWQEIVFGNDSGMLGRPVSMLTFLANAGSSGLEVAPFKATNLFIHIVCGAFLYRLVSRLSQRDSLLSRHASAVALMVSALWLLHPMQVSTVLYVVQRMAQLSTLFTLAALLAFVEARIRLSDGRTRGGCWLLFAAVPVATVMAVLSKENGALVPLLCAVIEFCYFRPSVRQQGVRAVNVFFSVFLILPGVLAIGLYALNPSRLLAGYAGRTFTLGERLLTESRVLFDYIGALLLPRGAALGLYTDDFVISQGLLEPPATLLAILGIFGLLFLAVWLRRCIPSFSVGVLLFFAGHAMESTVFPLEIYFEHRNYLPSVGFFIAMVGGASWLLTRAGALWRFDSVSRLALFASVSICLVLALSTLVRVSAWRHWPVLAEQGMRYHPNSLRAHLDHASMQMAGGDFDGAEETFERLAGLNVPLAQQVGYIDVVFVQCYRDKRVDPVAVGRLNTIVGSKLQLGQMLAFEMLGDLLQKQSCDGLDADQLATIIVDAVDNAGQPEGLVAIWRSRFIAARLYGHAGLLGEAVDQAAQAWMTGRADASVGVYLVALYNEAGDVDSARVIASDVRRGLGKWDQRNRRLLDNLDGRLRTQKSLSGSE